MRTNMNDQTVRALLSPRSVPVLIAFALASGALLSIRRADYPGLHTILDTGASLLSAVLAWQLWNVGIRVRRPFLTWLGISFAVTSFMEFLHVLVTVEWSGHLAWIAQAQMVLRPSTWPPAAHVLPLGILSSLGPLNREGRGAPAFATGLVIVSAALVALFFWLPRYTAPLVFGITRPALILVPVLWMVVAWQCWRLRSVDPALTDRILRPLALTASVLAVAHVAMLYSRAPHDTGAMVAHLGKVCGYLILLVALMQAEIAVRKQADRKLLAQLDRLSLLQRITRAIAERQDVSSILQVIIRSLEESLPIDFGCICRYDAPTGSLTVTSVGVRSRALALDLALTEMTPIATAGNGLDRCVQGQLIYEPDLGQVRFPLPQRLARGGLRSWVAVPLAVGKQVFAVLICARREAHGFGSGECEFLQQLSEHAALAAHQAQLYGELQEAYEELRRTQQSVMQQDRLRALGQMASGIAHDINNALSPVALYTDALLEKEPGVSERGREYLTTIQRSIEDVAETVARMREFYRPREPSAVLTHVNINLLVEQVIGLTRARWSDQPQHRGRVIELETHLAPELPPISGAEAEIRDALTNLIFNAVDAMPEGGRLTIRTTLTAGMGETQAGRPCVEVSDTGVGMSDEVRKHCLEPFFTTKGERGTGLGLAMVYGMVQRHGGDLEVESEPGRGTTMRLAFPAATATVAVDARAPEPQVLARRLRVLIVDDDPIVMESLRDSLHADGHFVTAADGGQAGIDAFIAAEKRGEPFAIVFTDLGMPHVDGRQVAAAIRAASPTTPIVLLTGWGQRLASERDVPAEVSRLLSKPPKLRELRAALAELVQNASGAGASALQDELGLPPSEVSWELRAEGSE